jgi:hypothetical protein
MKKKPKNRIPPPHQKLRLADNHTWSAPNGYKIFVVDRGAVSFNIPESWVFTKVDPIEILDRPEPDDNARIMVTVWNLPPGVDWSGLPLAPLMAQAAAKSDDDSKEEPKTEIVSQSEVRTIKRPDIELVWMEQKFIDPKEKRPAFSRMALARGYDIQIFITFDFWVDDLKKSEPVWHELLDSLQMGRYIEDPTKGVTLH